MKSNIKGKYIIQYIKKYLVNKFTTILLDDMSILDKAKAFQDGIVRMR